MVIIVCMSFVFSSSHCSLYIVDKRNRVCTRVFLPGFPSKDLSNLKKKWVGTQTHLPARKPLAMFPLCLSVYIIISSPCNAELSRSTCQIGREQRFILLPHRPAPALWRKKSCHGQLWKVCPGEMFIPHPAVLPSLTPSCCDPAQLQNSGRRQPLPCILADTDSCQARDCTQNRGKKLTWGHNPVFANHCGSHWFTLGSKLIFSNSRII